MLSIMKGSTLMGLRIEIVKTLVTNPFMRCQQRTSFVFLVPIRIAGNNVEQHILLLTLISLKEYILFL